ncbi:hypothetical protein ACFZCY_42760 [Streptomyces sp. NPDC007983]|uniref:hypothetical protein n=1 Tax=Streptomyces sp. NPDC007983 TaxID=3364800 RepID=UPI0036EC2DF9
MSLLTSLLRMRAADSGHAVRTSRLRHFHLSDRPLMLLPLRHPGPMARPLAVMLGTTPARPRLLVAPPSGSTIPVLTDLAAAVTDHIGTCQQHSQYLAATSTRPARHRYTDAPQILVPDPQTAAFLSDLGRDLRFRPLHQGIDAARSVRRLGQWLTYFTDRAEIPGSPALIPLTRFLVMHWVTGQSPLEDEDLATLLAWIDPPHHAASGYEAALAAQDPAALHRPAGPATGAAFDNERLEPLFDAYADSGTADQPRILQELQPLLATYLQPAWDLMWQAYTLLQALPEAESTPRRWKQECGTFTEMSTYLSQGGPPQPTRDQAVGAALRLTLREQAGAAFRAERAIDDPFARAELRTAGEAVAATVTAVAPEHLTRGPTGRAQWRPRLTLSTTDPVYLDPGSYLACHTHRKARYRIREITPTDSETLLELEITAGMNTVARPNHAVLPAPGDRLVFTTAPDRHRMPELPSRDLTPWTHGGPPADTPDDCDEHP